MKLWRKLGLGIALAIGLFVAAGPAKAQQRNDTNDTNDGIDIWTAGNHPVNIPLSAILSPTHGTTTRFDSLQSQQISNQPSYIDLWTPGNRSVKPPVPAFDWDYVYIRNETLCWENYLGVETCVGGGGGANSAGIEVNGILTTNSVSAAVLGNFNNATPAAPPGSANVTFQADALNPSHISAYVAAGAATAYVALPQNTFACGSGNTSVQQNQLVCTLAIVALAQGNTSVGPFAPQPADVALMGPVIPPGAGAGIRQTNWCHAFAGSNGGNCTVTLPSPTAPGNALVVVICASTQFTCSGPGTVTDSGGDIFTNKGTLGLGGPEYYLATNIVAGTTTVSCTGLGGIQPGTFICTAEEITNFSGIDATGGNSLAGGGGTTFTVSSSVNTISANDLILAFVAEGTEGCFAQQVFLSPMGTITGGAAADDISSQMYLTANVIGAAVAGTYNISATMTQIGGVIGCPQSLNPTMLLGLVAIKPSSATAPAAPPTWRYVNCVDLGYGLGTGNTIPNCAANDVSITTNPGSSSIASTGLIPSSAIGQIQRVSFYLYQVGAGNGCTGNAGVTATFSWTDLNSTAQSVTSASVSMGNTIGAGDFTQNQYMISAKSGTTINYSTTFASGTGCTTQPTYQLLMRATWGGQ